MKTSADITAAAERAGFTLRDSPRPDSVKWQKGNDTLIVKTNSVGAVLVANANGRPFYGKNKRRDAVEWLEARADGAAGGS